MNYEKHGKSGSDEAGGSSGLRKRGEFLMVAFGHPAILLLILPVLAGGFLLLRRSRKKILIATRIVIAVLLITALANPFSYVDAERTDRTPDLVIVSDTTNSMSLYDTGLAARLFESFSGTFSVRMDGLSGNYTALGEKILQNADGRSQILLVTDGSNNHGTDPEEALKAASAAGSTVSAVTPTLLYNDLSVEVDGDKTVIVGNDNVFSVTVRQANASNKTTYAYRIYVDNSSSAVQSGTGNFTDRASDFRESVFSFTQKFTTVGTHTIRVEISSGADTVPVNNNFSRSVYVIEKPDIIVVTAEKNASLSSIAGNLYNVTAVESLSSFGNLSAALSSSKVVILDNVYIKNITDDQTAALKSFVTEGGGLFVIGGQSSYDRPAGGGYLNSSFEKLLPVISEPSDWEGNRDVVLVIDISLSSESYAADGKTTIMENIKKTAVNIVNADYFSDSNIALVAFGNVGEQITEEFYYMSNPSDKALLINEITALNPSGSAISSSTDLSEGISKAAEITGNRIGEPLIIILTDGNLIQKKGQYDEILSSTAPLKKKGAAMMLLNIYSTGSIRSDQFRDSRTKMPYGQMLMNAYAGGVYLASPRGGVLDPDFASVFGGASETPKPDRDENKTGYTLLTYNSKHFITQGINLSDTTIAGFNDVTPKGGSDRLIITDTGSPVLTVWRCGLGRVASLTTDNGNGNGQRWATQLYHASNARIISRTINWVMEDPMPQEGVVISCPDTYAGVPVTLTAASYDGTVPLLTLDGKNLDLVLVSKDVYECRLTFDTPGTYSVSGYPVTVNYPPEYRDVGTNRTFETLISKYGGTVYPASQISTTTFMKQLSDDASYRTKVLLNYSLYLCLAALVIFLAEIIYRRAFEIRKLRRQIAEQEAREAASRMAKARLGRLDEEDRPPEKGE